MSLRLLLRCALISMLVACAVGCGGGQPAPTPEPDAAVGTDAAARSFATNELTSAQTVSIAWNASPSARVTAYRVYRDNALQGETAALTFAVPVTPGLLHQVAVASFGTFDKDGDGIYESEGEGEKSPAIPVQGPAVHGPGFLGCYVDLVNNVRALPIPLMSTGATTSACMTAARSRGLRYAGLQFRFECWGGDQLRYAQVPASECSMPCNAAPGELCGSSSRNSIYDSGYVPPVTQPATAPVCTTTTSPATVTGTTTTSVTTTTCVPGV